MGIVFKAKAEFLGVAMDRRDECQCGPTLVLGRCPMGLTPYIPLAIGDRESRR